MSTGEWNEQELIESIRRVVFTWCNGPRHIRLNVQISDAHGKAPDRVDPIWLPYMLLVALEWDLRIQLPLPFTSTLTELLEYVLRQPYPEDEDQEDMLEWAEVELPELL
jgi:hypothetical protein